MSIELIALVGSSFFIMLASLVGVLVVSNRFHSWIEHNVSYLVAFASGVFLIISYDLVFEALSSDMPMLWVWSALVGGFGVFFAFDQWYPDVHCHHTDAHCVSAKSKKGGIKVLIGDAFHNFGDGVLLAPAFLTDIRLGFAATFGIFVHELVQEISEYFVLKNAGFSHRSALVFNAVSASTVLLGALIGFYASSFEHVAELLIAFAAGAFVHILVADLLPDSLHHSHKDKKYLTYIAWGLAGIALITSVNMLSGAHTHEDVHGEDAHVEQQ